MEDLFTKEVSIDSSPCDLEILDTPGSEEMFYKVLIEEHVKTYSSSVVVGTASNP